MTPTSNDADPWLPLPAEAWDEPTQDDQRARHDPGLHDPAAASSNER